MCQKNNCESKTNIRHSAKANILSQLTLIFFKISIWFWGRRISLARRSTGSIVGKPTSVKRSTSIADLTLTSRGESQPRDGERFTSSSHGFRDESIKMSKPYSSALQIKDDINLMGNRITFNIYIQHKNLIKAEENNTMRSLILHTIHLMFQ